MTKLLLTTVIAVYFSVCLLNAQNKSSVELLKKHVEYLASDELEGRGFGSASGKKAADYIITQFKSYGIKPFGKSYFHTFNYRTDQLNIVGNNVVGIIEGSDENLKDEYILLGGHYDHIGFKMDGEEKVVFNGADDNASGIATIIELGRLFVANKSKLKRSIILVAFDGEESGLIGSKNMVNDNFVPLDKIKLMFSIDMVGMLNTNKGLEMKGIEWLENWETLFVEPANGYQMELTKKGKKISFRTDTKHFGEAGIPSIHVTTGTKSPYHKPGDDAKLLEYDGMEKITNYFYDIVFTLANQHNISSTMKFVTDVEGKKHSEIFEAGIRFNIGGNKHNYKNDFYLGKSAFAFEGGVYGKVNIGKRWAFQPELIYSTLGSDYVSGKYRTHAVSVPANILFALATTNGIDGTFYIVGGAYYSYFFNGKLDGKTADFTKTFNDTEYGINAGFIFEVENMQLGFTRKIGLSNLHKDDNLKTITNQGSYFTIGMRF